MKIDFTKKDFYLENDDMNENDEPIFADYTVDLTRLAEKGQLEECFGREKELLEMMEILVRRQKNNPVLVGEPGVGKTAIIELFAVKLAKNLVPFVLQKRRILSLDLTKILAGAEYRGQFEAKFKLILDEILRKSNIILFIDEIHTIVNAGAAEGSLDAANILKPMLSRSGFQCVGATTVKEYQHIEKDPALNRRFQPIKVEEPSVDDAIKILFGLKPNFELFHNVFITPSAIESAVELSKKYIYDRFLPDKAIDLIDRASAKEVINATNIANGSLISAIVNAGLNNLGKLRIEAFRRGDIHTEFLFQEIDKAYRNFLLKWIENPSQIKEDKSNSELISPISQILYDKMKAVVFAKADELLFASNHPRKQIEKYQKLKNLSSIKNKRIVLKFIKRSDKSPFYLNFYRFKLLSFNFFENYIDNLIKIKFSGKDEKNILPLGISYYNNNIIKQNNILLYFFKNIILNKNKNLDYFYKDIEIIHKYTEKFSDLEKVKISTFNSFIKHFHPIIKKTLVDDYQKNSTLNFTKQELKEIYTLLGYISLDTSPELNSEFANLYKKNCDFSKLKRIVNDEKIKSLLSDITGVPLQSLSEKESRKLLNLEKILQKRVIGQKDAVKAISKAIRRSRLGIQNPNRPIASFFFCGPTGVGKTEVTKTLASVMFGSEKSMIRFDMSEFMEKFSISRLIGSPPGYIGYEDGGQLTDAVRRKPYSIILFDELEKGHPDVLNILLQILDDGRLTDSQKRLVLFDNTVIIMTSNAGASEILEVLRNSDKDQNSLVNYSEKVTDKDDVSYEDPISGTIKFLKSPIKINYKADLSAAIQKEFHKSFYNFEKYKAEKFKNNQTSIRKENLENPDEKLKANLKTIVLERLSNIFLPEFLNRIDDIIIFEPLKSHDLLKIAKIMIDNLAKRLKLRKIELSVNEAVKIKLTRESYNPIFGARPLRRTITKYLEDGISNWLLSHKIKIGNKMKKIKFILNESDEITLIEEN